MFELGAITICRVINSCELVKISLYAPSFWYIDIFGLVKNPTVNEILMLLSLQIVEQSIHYEIENASYQNCENMGTITVLFSHLIYKLVKVYSTNNPKIIEKYLCVMLPNLPLTSVARAYLTPVIKMIDSKDANLQLYYRTNRAKSYCIGERVLNMRLVRKNWFQCERHFYFAYLYSAIDGKQL